MIRLFFLLVISFPLLAQDREAFRKLLQSTIQKDPAFKEVDLETPLYSAQVTQGLSHLVMPKISLSYGKYQQNAESVVVSEVDKYRAGHLTASLDVFSFGSDWNSYQSARLQRRAQSERVQSRLLLREEELARLLLDYVREGKNVEILARLVDLKERALDVSKKRYERGNLSEEDFSKVKLDVSNARAELVVATQELNTLKARVGAYGVEDRPLSYPWESALTVASIDELLKINVPVGELPQYLELRFLEEASASERNAARGDMLGNVALNFTRSVYEFPQQEQWEWRASLVYTLPLFDRFDQYVAFKRNDIAKQVNEVRAELRRRESQSNQVADADNLRLSLKNWSERQEALKISSRLYNRSLGQFNQGQLSVNELFVDQDRLLRTEQIANLALYQLHQSVLAFCHSRGKAHIQGCF